jgi:hypothetical protein
MPKKHSGRRLHRSVRVCVCVCVGGGGGNRKEEREREKGGRESENGGEQRMS